MESELPNPFTPLAFLPPALASQFEVSRYLFAITLGSYGWDIAVNLGSDYRLLFEISIRFPTVVYYVSRIFTLAYILTSFIFQVGHVPNCQALQIALGVCSVIAQSSTSLLFLLRARAVWHGHRMIQMVFTLLWLGVIAGALTVPIGIEGAHIGPTQQCINTKVASYTEMTAIMSLINDTFVFLAISYRIIMYATYDDSTKARVETFFGGGSIPRLSRSLLQGGQHYYLIAVCGNIVLLVLVKLSDLPPTYQGMCTIPVLAIVNAMACTVFREIKFGSISHDGTMLVRSTDLQTLTAPFDLRRNAIPLQNRRPDDTGLYSMPGTTTHVAISRTAETDSTAPLEVHVVGDHGKQYDESKLSESGYPFPGALTADKLD